jgi:L-alanine-DL-glutamate epimerase-like enolase superfamily enzyme
MRIAQVLEPYNLHWLEIDSPDPDAIRQIKDSTKTKICTGETLVHMKEYLPFFQRHAADVYMLDVPWTGIVQGEGRDLTPFSTTAPHNHSHHLSTFMTRTCGADPPNAPITNEECRAAPRDAWRGERR